MNFSYCKLYSLIVMWNNNNTKSKAALFERANAHGKAFQAWRSNAVLLRNQFSNIKMCLYYHLEEIFYITSKMIDIRSEQLLVLFLFHIEINQRKY